MAGEDKGNFATKETTLEDDESSVAIDIQTQHAAVPKVLVYQGTYCQAHGLEDKTIIDGIDSVLKYADVDYYAETEHYSKDKHGELFAVHPGGGTRKRKNARRPYGNGTETGPRGVLKRDAESNIETECKKRGKKK